MDDNQQVDAKKKYVSISFYKTTCLKAFSRIHPRFRYQVIGGNYFSNPRPSHKKSTLALMQKVPLFFIEDK